MALHSLPCLPEPSWKGGGRPFPPGLRPLLLWAWGVPGRASCRRLRARLLRDAFRSLRERLSVLCVHKQLPLATLEEEI